MRLPQLQRPALAAVLSGGYRPVLTNFALPIRPAIQSIQRADGIGNDVVEGRRYASVKSQGAYRIPNKKTIGKKLGAKKSGDQFVIPGNIIFKQRGSIWHPGENTLRGRDHTIHATASGYVKYYRDPVLHPDRQFIGVAFNKEDVLPYPKNEPRRRRLGMVATLRKQPQPRRGEIGASGIPTKVVREAGIWDLEKLEERKWKSKRQLREANEVAAMRNKKAEEKRREKHLRKLAKKTGAGAEAATTAPGGASVETAAAQAAAAGGETKPTPIVAGADVSATTTTTTRPVSKAATTPITDAQDSPEPAAAADVDGRKPRRSAKRKLKLVHPMAYVQKRYLERRRTKVLHLNPRSYAYSESNAAIGRLSSRTMYTAPWKIGGRRARFRARRRKHDERMKVVASNRELVRREREREKIAEEAALRKRLEKQRARGAGKAAKAEKKEGGSKEAQGLKNVVAQEVGETEKPVAGEKPVEGEKPVRAQKSVEGAQPVAIEKPVESTKPVEDKKSVENQKPVVGEKPVEGEKSVAGEKPVEGDKPVKG